MNKKGQRGALGFALLMVFFVIFLVLMATIAPFKETLDTVRGNSALNCLGTPDFNQTSYNSDTANSTFNRLVRRPPCFVTGISMVWFIGAMLIASSIWVTRNWRKLA